MLQRLQDGATLLDVGCGYGQDLRFLALDGAPVPQLWGLDAEPALWEWGLQLFKDREQMEGRFRKGDILHPGSPDSIPPVDLVLASQVFHLFDWETQIQAAKHLSALVKPGGWIVGFQVGSKVGRSVPKIVRIEDGNCDGETAMAFFHNNETWMEMWKVVERESGARWEVESGLSELGEWGLESEDWNWMGRNAVGIAFVCRKVEVELGKL